MQLSYLITITKRSEADSFTAFFQEENVPLALRMLGTGTARDNILRLLGLAENEKEVFMCAVSDQTAHDLLKKLVTRMNIDGVGNGIAYSVPISSIAGAATLQHLVSSTDASKEEQKMSETNKAYELVVVITNKTYVDTVMDAAYAAGAGGGTVVHARGAASGDQSDKFFGISLAPEREMIFIVLKSELKNDVMKAISTEAGMQTPAKSIILSIPVNSVAGLREAYIDQVEGN
ncbi:MAG: P-II family nitrogen regulator [Clostridia bacterium]|nr:P-II family nitrogen regulator [Clostridia bacterium]